MSTTTTATRTNTAPTSSPIVRPIKNGFGADITGLDFANGVTDEAYQLILNAVKAVGH